MSSFTITPRQPIPVVLAHLRGEAARVGATVTGDDTEGTIRATAPGGMEVEATYATAGPLLVLTITKKPAFVPDALIEGALKSFFGADAVR